MSALKPIAEVPTARTLAQQRAAFALEKIEQVKGWPNESKAKYARLARKLPAMVLHNGLGQALAFHLADAKDDSRAPAGALVLHLTEWLAKRSLYAGLDPAQLDSLISKLVAGDSRAYLRAQQETLALFDWMKKFADAFLPKEDA